MFGIKSQFASGIIADKKTGSLFLEILNYLTIRSKLGQAKIKK